MTDLLSTGLTWLHKERAKHIATTVTYERPAVASASVSATLASTGFEKLAESGFQVRAHSVDFLIDVADLLSPFIEPELGDQITFGSDKFVVADLGGTGHWRYDSAYKKVFRVHTKRIES